ncbi:MAG: iron-sulfur cluster-binding domain-containing protein [Saprospiraceae bacterium]|nr:iron-sulfur cluster-binding domain-containing protein [Saprospiraceae bacterium]
MEKKRELRIVRKTWETADTATFALEPTDGHPLRYLPGQYVSLVFSTQTGEKRRAYSFSTCPGVDALPAITVKRVVNGEFSNWLLRYAEPGNVLTATEPHGRFLLPPKQPDTIFYIAAGSGITPVMSHLKAILAKPHGAKIILYYANRDSQSTIFKPQIDQWIKDFPARFRCLYFFSKEKKAENALHRHLNNQLLEELLSRHFADGIAAKQLRGTLFYLCAPKAMMRMAEMTLRAMSFPEKNIVKENFVAETRLPTQELDTTRTHLIVASNARERIEFKAFAGETILNAALRQGIPLPYTCKSGVCFTCLAKCTKGEVDVAFVDSVRREGPGDMVNTCIGYAATERVELWYE